MLSTEFDEYGVDFAEGLKALRRWDRSIAPSVKQYYTDRSYSQAVRRLARYSQSGMDAIDGRILAAGWCWASPRRFHDALPSFLHFWQRAVDRPAIVGSSHNIVDPADAYAAWTLGVPAAALRLALIRVIVQEAGRARRASPEAPYPRRITRTRHDKLVRAGRAAARTSAGLVVDSGGHPLRGHTLGLDAWAALGRVSPEMQRAVLWSVQFMAPGLIRSRDLPWDVARRRCSGPVARSAWATGRRQVEILCAQGRLGPWSLWLPSDRRALELSRGVPPTEMARYALMRSHYHIGELTTREAGIWVSAGRPEIRQWYVDRACDGVRPAMVADMRSIVGSARSLRVIRWLESVSRHQAQWDALTRQRPLPPAVARHAPLGATYQLAARVDEITDADIPLLSAGPVAVLERAAARWTREQEERLVADATPFAEVAPWRDAKVVIDTTATIIVSVIRTPASLVQLGREEGHCVGGYAQLISAGTSVICTATDGSGLRSTAEIDPRRMRVAQHFAAANTAPSWLSAHRQGLDAWLQMGPIQHY